MQSVISQTAPIEDIAKHSVPASAEVVNQFSLIDTTIEDSSSASANTVLSSRCFYGRKRILSAVECVRSSKRAKRMTRRYDPS